jgi:hypothetical protein
MIVMQTKALFIDAYRELNAKKLFWITMALNFVAVVVFASLGITAKGVTFWHWQFESLFFNTGLISEELFYKLQFTSWGAGFWLSWVTTILALVSTAGIIPDLISGGTIEPVLSKPIGRVRLFLTKYLTGLLFVALQILVFSLGCFIVLGIRGGAWEFGLFMALPIVLAFFSFLFSFCALVGLVTRSTIASLLLTMLFWSMIFVVNLGDNIMLQQREGWKVRLQDRQEVIEPQIRFAETRMEQWRNDGRAIPGEGDEPMPEGVTDVLEAVNPTLRQSRERVLEAEEAVETWTAWSTRVFALKSVLPKTQETIALLERHLISDEELSKLMGANEGDFGGDDDVPAMADPRAAKAVAEAMRERTVLWILGTSFIFEGVLLTLCCWIFARRDF